MGIKQKIFDLIDGGEQPKSIWHKRIELFIMALIILSVIAIILESYQHLEARYKNLFYAFEVLSVAIFSLEYILRLWTADLKYPEASKLKARLKFVFSPIGLIDLLAILPFYIPFLIKIDLRFIRVLRVVRLLRVLKLNRHSKSLQIIGKIFMDKRSELSMTIFVTFILILISSTIMYNIEHTEQPEKFPDIISTFWWAIATLTTVGYGDVYPKTGWGQLISGIIALLGIGLVALPTGILSASFIEELGKKNGKKKKGKNLKDNYCPCCGTKLIKDEQG